MIRPGRGEVLAGCSGFLLLVVMSLDWFGPRYEGTLQSLSTARDAWESLEYIRIALAITGTITVLIGALRIAGATPERLDRAYALVALLGTGSLLLVVYRILDPPDFGSLWGFWGPYPIGSTVKFPVFIGLLAALGIALGGWWAHRANVRKVGEGAKR